MIVAIEGLDGVGKSSVAKRLAEKLGFIYVEKPFSNVFQRDQMEKYMEIKKGLNLQQDRSLLAWFYGLNLLFGKDYYKNENVVYDRFLVSNYSWILDEDNEFIFESMVKAVGVPDVTVLLTAHKEVVISRLKHRNAADKDLSKIQYMDRTLDNCRYLLTKYNIPYIEIDVSELTIEEIANQIFEMIKGGGSDQSSILG